MEQFNNQVRRSYWIESLRKMNIEVINEVRKRFNNLILTAMDAGHSSVTLECMGYGINENIAVICKELLERFGDITLIFPEETKRVSSITPGTIDDSLLSIKIDIDPAEYHPLYDDI